MKRDTNLLALGVTSNLVEVILFPALVATPSQAKSQFILWIVWLKLKWKVVHKPQLARLKEVEE